MKQHEPTSHPTRRTIVRTAGHAAWAAPVVIAASAAPAFAASQINLDVVDFSRTGQSTAGSSHTVRFKVRNNGVVIPSGTSIALQFEVVPTAGTATYETFLGTNWTAGWTSFPAN